MPAAATSRVGAARRSCRPTRRSSSASVTAKMLEGRGDEIPVSLHAGRRHLALRHRRVREAQHRRRRAGVGAGYLHPVRPVQLRLPARRDPRQVLRRGASWTARPRASSRRRSTCAASPTCASRCSSTSRTAPAAALCVEACPAHSPSSPSSRRSTCATSCRCVEPERREHRVLRDAAGERPRAGRFRQRARRAVPRAAVRVLRRLRRLRRDAVPEAAVAAVRRPHADRQRHRLLLDLRRQPAGHAVVEEPRGPRPGLVELAVRGQCRVRPRLPPGGRQASGAGAACSRTSWRPSSEPSWSRPS